MILIYQEDKLLIICKIEKNLNRNKKMKNTKINISDLNLKDYDN